MGHTTQAGVDLLGFGPSAISELRGGYAQSFRDLEHWEQAVLARGLATMRGHAFSADDLERRWIIGRILCHGELRASRVRGEFGGRASASASRASWPRSSPRSPMGCSRSSATAASC